MSQTAAFSIADVNPAFAVMEGESASGVSPESASTTYGTTGTGHDISMYGDTSYLVGGVTTPNYLMWDASVDSLLLLGSSAKFRLGTFSGAAEGGSSLSASNSASFRVYCDDGNAAIGSGTLARAGVFRHQLRYAGGNREQEAAGVIGQIVSVAGTNRHNMAGTWGSYEARTSLVVDGQAAATDTWAQAAVLGRVGVGSGITTINANGVLAGFAAMSSTASFAGNSGVYAAFYAGAWSGNIDWAYGMYLEGGKFTTGVAIGSCTTGITIAASSAGVSSTVTASSAATGHLLRLVDSSTSGTAVASKVQFSSSGSGGTYNIGEWIDFTVGGNVTNAHPIYMYVGNVDDKTISNYTGIYMYVEDIGNAVSNFACVSLETNMESSGGGTGEHCFIRFREHDTTVASAAVFRFEGQAAGYLATFDGTAGTEDGSVMFDSATCDQSADCRFRVSVPMGGGGAAADRYIYLYPV